MSITIVCIRCTEPIRFTEGVARVGCSCGSGLTAANAIESTSNSPATDLFVPGLPALVEDLASFMADGLQELTVEEAASRYRTLAEGNLSEVQSLLEPLVRSAGGDFAGLDHALKMEHSLQRKIRNALACGYAFERGSAIADALRFTVLLDPSEYVHYTQEIVWSLQDRGHVIVEERNSWGWNDPYSGLNYSIALPDGSRYELQLHTPDSHTAKQGRLHSLYAEYRDPEVTPERARELWREMSDVWRDVEIPPGVMGFGGDDAIWRYDPPG